MPLTTAHIINHTHWDREWFLTSVYTSRWIPPLIDRLEQRAAANPEFRYFFDGQTLVIEDLFQLSQEHGDKAAGLIQSGCLTIGPYYCQPDWQLTSGEQLIRNLYYGQQDVKRLGGSIDTGWLVDTFGHISQSPQIHSLFGIQAVYVWRGVPELEPYFHWQGADGTRLYTLYLLGGYRNLYGVTHAPQVAVRRLHAEVEKLQAFYPTGDIPLFDGYDLEDNPEDPVSFYAVQNGIRPDITILETDPAHFAKFIIQKELPLPVINSELNSGKYGATFPGTLSARDYLKVMAYDCARLLYNVCEPLAVMAAYKGRSYNASQYSAWGRKLLQNSVHDCICGVSIDQVHEKMEYIYRQVFDEELLDVHFSLNAIFSSFRSGFYAVSTNPFKAETWQSIGGRLFHVVTDGVGVWPVEDILPVVEIKQPTDTFTWHNDHYSAVVNQDGQVELGDGRLGSLVVFREKGDTYSDESGNFLGTMVHTTPVTVQEKSSQHTIIGFTCRWQGEDQEEWAGADVRLFFDPSPVLKWQIDLDTRGADLRIEMIFATAIPGQPYAGMPFDVVPRQAADHDLLPRQVPEELSGILLGQRELGAVYTFPFQSILCLSDGERSAGIFAKGIHAYAADETGTVRLTLRRTVEWLTRPDLMHRLGDAGPFFYVPDARCERTVSHCVAFLAGRQASPTSIELHALHASYCNPALIVQSEGNGSEQAWQMLEENMPLSSLSIQNKQVMARFYNPTPFKKTLNQVYQETDIWGEPIASASEINPKQILTVALGEHEDLEEQAVVESNLLNPPEWRVGKNAGLPDPQVFIVLEEKIRRLEAEVAACRAQIAQGQDQNNLILQHRYYVLQRECTELKFSLLLNQRKLAEQGQLRFEYLFEPDHEIAALGLELNQLRMKRRIFDYIVQLL